MPTGEMSSSTREWYDLREIQQGSKVLSHSHLYVMQMVNPRHSKMAKKEVKKERPKYGKNNA
jgi:hypothetical protein